MALGGNPEDLRSLARRLRKQADEVEATATRLKAGQEVQWTGIAAVRFQERLAAHGQELETSRDSVTSAATKADQLADALEERQRAIAAAIDKLNDAANQARSTLNRFAGAVWEDLTNLEQANQRKAEHLLDELKDPPALGDPHWIDIAKELLHP